MKIIKRSQLALLSLSLIMIAGYINYKYDPEREKNLGQTVHVSGSDVFLYDNSASSNNSNVTVYTEKNTSISNNKKNTESSIATFKEERDNMFSELEATYKEAVEKEQDTATREKYQKKLDEVVEKKHLISIIENLIKTKGIKNLVIVPTGDNINVIVESDKKLTETEIAIIQRIIQDEFGIEADKICINQSK